MSDTPTPRPTDGPAATLAARLEQLHRELATEARRTNRSAALTTIVGALALVLLGGYFAYGYTMFEEATRPARLVDVAQTMLEDNLPGARKSIEDEVIRSSPAWAESLSKQAVAALPTAREKLRDYALGRIDASVEEAKLITEDRFRNFLKQNRAKLDEKFKELGEGPQLAERSLNELELMLEAQLQDDMKATSGDLLASLTSMNAKLKTLGDGTGPALTPEEQNERRVLMLARRIQEERSGSPTGAAVSAPPLAARRRPLSQEEPVVQPVSAPAPRPEAKAEK